jgi:hypothetical protein
MPQNDKREEKPSEEVILALPILAMAALIGVLALLMRSTGKW